MDYSFIGREKSDCSYADPRASRFFQNKTS